MGRWKKRRRTADGAKEPPKEREESRCEVKFNQLHLDDMDTANRTEKSLLKLLQRICEIYTDRYHIYSQSLVNQHVLMLSLLGLPAELSSKSLHYNDAGKRVGAHSVCSRLLRATQYEDKHALHLTQVLRLFEWAERATNCHLYARFGLAVPSFMIKRNIFLLFRQIATLNELITERRWRELGCYLNSCIFLHTPHLAWLYSAHTKNRDTFVESKYRSVRHDVFVSALLVWQAALLRLLQAERSREWKSSRLVDLLRRALSQCKMTSGVRVPEHILLTDGVCVLISLDEALMIHRFHEADMRLWAASDLHRRPFEAYKLLAQAWHWLEEAPRPISGIVEPGAALIEALLEVAEREGSAGVVFALSAFRGFMKIAEAVDNHESLDRLLSYAMGCPRAARPLAAALREHGLQPQADEIIKRAVEPSSAIHASDPVWLEWAGARMEEEEEEKAQEEKHTTVAGVLLAFLDYGSNRANERAWSLLERAMAGSDRARWPAWWAERSEWWPHLHTAEMERRGARARKKVMRRLQKLANPSQSSQSD